MSDIKGVFDIVKNVQTSSELLSEEEVREFGNPFIMNRAMSFNTDTLFFADEASIFQNVDAWSQYLFYFYSVEKKKYRPGRWEKKAAQLENLKVIQEAYDVSESKAMEYLDVLTEEQIETIVSSMNKGGIINKKSKRGS